MSGNPLTRRREQRQEQWTAWFMQEWERLDADERQAVSDLVLWLHQEGLRRRPATVAWLEQWPL